MRWSKRYVEPFTYFLAPSVLFFSLIWLPWHFLHLVVEIGFLAPHLKHILKNNLRCCAICFFAVSVIGIYTALIQRKALFYLSVLTLLISQKCTRRLAYSQSYANSRVLIAIPVGWATIFDGACLTGSKAIIRILLYTLE
jgi:uncharacterized membrane protein YjjP (DUF1212 family)